MTQWTFLHNGSEFEIGAERAGDSWRVTLPGDATYDLNVLGTDGGLAELSVLGPETTQPGPVERHIAVAYVRTPSGLSFSWMGQVYELEPKASAAAASPGGEVSGAVIAPTGGVIADLLVEAGQAVDADQEIAVIEAMKVMTPVLAPCAGIVRELAAVRGQRIERGAAIAHIAPAEPEATGGAPV